MTLVADRSISDAEVEAPQPGMFSIARAFTDLYLVSNEDGMATNLTADFTVNPDFSQIESDRPQIEVNQRFPLFFSELRPFFVEGGRRV